MKKNWLNNNISFLNVVRNRLKKHRIVSAEAEAEAMVRHYSRLSRIDLYTGEKRLSDEARRQVRSAVRLRLSGQPLFYILKETMFCGFRFGVNRDTLIPRPETELLVEEAITLLRKHPIAAPKILDVGTGSGCIAISLTLLRPECKMTALDVSAKALKILRNNMKIHGLQQNISVVQSDLFARMKSGRGTYDMIVSNPPYISKAELKRLPKDVRKEPKLALDGGSDGLKVIFKLITGAQKFLKRGGYLLIEIGDGQAERLRDAISKYEQYRWVRVVRDLNDIERILVLQKING